jgi:hypothetical protein
MFMVSADMHQAYIIICDWLCSPLENKTKRNGEDEKKSSEQRSQLQ